MQIASPAPRGLARVALAVSGASRRHSRFVVIAMLTLLHVAVLRGAADGWARMLLLAHLGLVLLWQPFLSTEQRLSLAQGLLIALGAAVVTLWLDWWLLAFWIVVLAGLVGGKVFLHEARRQRRWYLVVLVYLLSLLAIVVLPEIAPRREIAPEIRTVAEYGLPLVFVLLAILPSEPEGAEAPQMIDFFYSVFLMLVLGIVVLGSFAFMTLQRVAYLEALTVTVFLVAGTILLLALAWSPRAGSSGLALFFSRYLFSIGMPIERWLHFLAGLASTENRPERFLAAAAEALARMPWIAGATWEAGGEHGEVGSPGRYRLDYADAQLRLALYSRYRVGPALEWHLQLLGRLLAEFYRAKLREQKLREASVLEAVHQTGARLTHDVKNLLQSLGTLCALAEKEPDSPQLLALVRRQLPAIAERLAATLQALERPGIEDSSLADARQWWSALVRRYEDRGVAFTAGAIAPEARLPRALFDSAAENLLANALAKRLREPGIAIRLAFESASGARLRVCDSGSALAPQITDRLFRAPLASAGGLGIGLWQSARLAEASGYRLLLRSNRDGEVCFELAPRDDQGSTPAAIMRP
ncbi:MAG: ATP-binding protein [Pseudomonadota bacterium]